jgi:hypothetical protein
MLRSLWCFSDRAIVELCHCLPLRALRVRSQSVAFKRSPTV